MSPTGLAEPDRDDAFEPYMNGECDVHVRLGATIVSHAILLPRNSWRKFRSMPFWCQMWTLVRNVPPLNYDLDRSSFWPMRTSKGDNLLRPQAQFDTIVNLINCICLPFYICWLGLKWFSGISNLVFLLAWLEMISRHFLFCFNVTYEVPFSVWYEAAYIPTFLFF